MNKLVAEKEQLAQDNRILRRVLERRDPELARAVEQETARSRRSSMVDVRPEEKDGGEQEMETEDAEGEPDLGPV